jgi:hypothetical protein
LGYKDWTVVLFGYYDFKDDKVIIAEELVTYGQEMHLQTLGWDIKKVEDRLFTNSMTNEFMKPKKRVADHNLVAINEILKATNYQIRFEAAKKDDKHAALNFLRLMIQNNKIYINPKCKVLIRHLKNAKWASITNKDTFARCPEGSHYDAVDALSYLLRAVDFKANPYPKGFGLTTRSEDLFNRNISKPIENENVYRKILNLKVKK